jgi:hypothetical protein
MRRRSFLQALVAPALSLLLRAKPALAKLPFKELRRKIRTLSPFWTHIDPIPFVQTKDFPYVEAHRHPHPDGHIVAVMTNPARARSTNVTTYEREFGAGPKERNES